MNDVITLDENYSTTRRVINATLQNIADEVSQFYKPEDKFETVLLLPEGEGRQGEGGLRTQGYFKVGGIIHSHLSEDTSVATKPLITVVTVVFNGEKFLEETILSVINQTYDNVEYIIIDGGSTDGTLDIIKKYEHAIDYWVSEKDNGIYDAMNKGLKVATGDWVIFMNAGDSIYQNETFQNVSDKLIEKNKFSFVVGNTKRIYEGGYFISKPEFFCDPRKGMGFSHQSVFSRLEFHKNIPFDLKFKLMADFDFFCKAKEFEYIPIIISNFATGGQSRIKWKLNLRERGIIFKKYFKTPSLNNYLVFYNTVFRFYITSVFLNEEKIKKIKKIILLK